MADSSKKKMIRHKAWSLVRMALLWGRKGGVFKRWPLFLQLRNLFTKHLKALASHHHHDGRYLYPFGERQLSFDETPLFNAKNKKKKMHHRLLPFPCIALPPPPPVEFDYDFEVDGQDYSDDVRSYGYDDEEEEEEKGVDVRAEEFIAKFYEQIKLQRQISYLESRV